MHDSMMIADVGDMLNVSGSRMATPFAPPRPGSTPISTPRTMPTIISPMFRGVSTTEKPWKRELSSSIGFSVAGELEQVEFALEQRHLEPDFEHEEEEGHDHDGGDRALHCRLLAQQRHEQRDVHRRSDVHA